MLSQRPNSFLQSLSHTVPEEHIQNLPAYAKPVCPELTFANDGTLKGSAEVPIPSFLFRYSLACFFGLKDPTSLGETN